MRAAEPSSGFPPILGPLPRLLILGSMPSPASILAQQYYGHPRNAFWPIWGALIGAGPEQSYARRCQVMIEHGIAVWDVLASCVRPGSLDSAIDPASVQVNDIGELCRRQPELRLIGLNGGAAWTFFHRHCAAALQELPSPPTLCRLPSTSPANARLDLAAKTAAWRQALLSVLE